MKESFRVAVSGSEYTFCGSHFLVFADGETSEPLHGHDYRTTVEVIGPIDSATGWVVDFLVLKSVVQKHIRPLDHRTLLPEQSPYLKITCVEESIEVVAPDRRWTIPQADCSMLPIAATTTELIAQFLARSIHADLVAQGAETLDSLEVTLEESGGFRAACCIEF